jgi:ABC-type sugar transport system ATPase subunit
LRPGWRLAPACIMFDEPTRGVDVGAKAEIYALLRQLAAAGAAVLVISSELPQLLLLSRRIGVVKPRPAHTNPGKRQPSTTGTLSAPPITPKSTCSD